jgi:hypothetical protein
VKACPGSKNCISAKGRLPMPVARHPIPDAKPHPLSRPGRNESSAAFPHFGPFQIVTLYEGKATNAGCSLAEAPGETAPACHSQARR